MRGPVAGAWNPESVAEPIGLPNRHAPRSFDAKGGLERELSKRNQMNAKLERALNTAKDELDTLQLQLRDKKALTLQDLLKFYDLEHYK